MHNIQAKVCGINNLENLKSLLTLPVDMVGFIFNDKSKRNCTLSSNEVIDAFKNFGTTCKKVGVFENADIENVIEKYEQFDLDFIQLNGSESIFYCQKLKEYDVKLIKSFQVDERFCYSNSSAYSFFCDYFLFEGAFDLTMESNVRFNWSNLQKYKGKTPFFLSGNIGPDDVQQIRNLEINTLSFVNVNTVFEVKPGYKNLDSIAEFLFKVKRPERFNKETRMNRVVNG